MMVARLFVLALAVASAACSSTPTAELDLRSNPAGAQVWLSRRGQKNWQAKLGPLKGDVKAEDLEEGFLLIGTSPLTYTQPLVETESDATLMGVGGKVVLEYEDGVLRFKKPGYETVERHVRFQDGEVKVKVQMPVVEAPAP